MQVMIYNLLPPPGSPPLAPDTPGESWVVPPAAVPVQADVMRAMEKVSCAALLVAPCRSSSLLGCCMSLGVVGGSLPHAGRGMWSTRPAGARTAGRLLHQLHHKRWH
jgi:hypothetical protein